MMTVLKTAWSAVSGALGGLWGYAAAFAAGGVILGWAAVHVSSLGYERTISDLKAEYATTSAINSQATLAQFAADAGQVHAAAVAFGQQQTDMTAQFAALSRDFKNAIKARPLPAGCTPDTERLRIINAAIAKANAARGAGGKPSPAVPSTP